MKVHSQTEIIQRERDRQTDRQISLGSTSTETSKVFCFTEKKMFHTEDEIPHRLTLFCRLWSELGRTIINIKEKPVKS